MKAEAQALQQIEEEEKKEGPLKNNESKNSEYEDDPFDVEPVVKDGKTTGSHSVKTGNINVKSLYGTSAFEEESSEIEISPMKPKKTAGIDPNVWQKARVELADLLKGFG